MGTRLVLLLATALVTGVLTALCGVDGKDYVNACEADCAGMQIDCKGSCPCKGDCDCSKSDWNPVCGGDGLTYINKCKAQCEKTEVVCKGSCPCQGINNQNEDSKVSVDEKEPDDKLDDEEIGQNPISQNFDPKEFSLKPRKTDDSESSF